MYCSACGQEVPDDALFCRSCGVAVGAPKAASEGPTPAPTVVPSPGDRAAPPPVVAILASPPPPPQGTSRRGLWIILAAAAVVVIAVAVAVPLLLARDGGDEVAVTTTSAITESSTTVAETTDTSEPKATDTSEPDTSTSSTSDTVAATGDPGDSAGEWVQTEIPGAPAGVVAVAVSSSVLLMQTQTDSGYGLYAYYFITDKMVELPVEGPEVGGIDVFDTDVVWWEGTYDKTSDSYTDQHIYFYTVPGGPKVEVASGRTHVGYPQVAGILVSWVEDSPWTANPEEYRLMPIYASFVGVGAGTDIEPWALVPSAVASITGDATWTYSLGTTFVAWEQAAAAGGLETGTYVQDVTSLLAKPQSIGTDAWRPSICFDNLVYRQNGLEVLDLKTGEKREIDPDGDFPTAAPTFAAYYRPVESGDGTQYEIVARGLKGNYEQVLGRQADAPWLSPSIAADGQYVAFVADGTLHIFKWQGR